MFTEVISRAPTGFITTDYILRNSNRVPTKLIPLSSIQLGGEEDGGRFLISHTEWLIPGLKDDPSFKRRDYTTESTFYRRTELY